MLLAGAEVVWQEEEAEALASAKARMVSGVTLCLQVAVGEVKVQHVQGPPIGMEQLLE
jgi:hypothetical protein